ncbi:MAG: type II toxin-antitoxin system RelE/ParE family toxin [Magnetococcales bacterium]|nr:type II toxin-antitoxin system RelE/ParE family toxin [Magnetococcales bacterium]
MVITPFAADNLREIHRWLKNDDPNFADRWLKGIKKAILDLTSMPESHSIAPESALLESEIRQILHGRGTPWRIFFTIDDSTVYVLHIRHGRRDFWRGTAEFNR